MQPPHQPPAWTPMSPSGQQPWGQPPYGAPGGFGPGGFGPQYPPPKQANVGLIIGLVVGAFMVLLVGLGVLAYMVTAPENGTPKTFTSTDGTCEVRVPPTWSKQTNLNDQAGIQVANTSKEEYLLVLTEAKRDFAADMTLDKYANIIVDAMKTKGTIKGITVTSPVHTQVGGLPAVQYEIEGTIDYLNLRYLVTFVDGKTHYHQIMTWSLASRFADNRAALLDATNSFREH